MGCRKQTDDFANDNRQCCLLTDWFGESWPHCNYSVYCGWVTRWRFASLFTHHWLIRATIALLCSAYARSDPVNCILHKLKTLAENWMCAVVIYRQKGALTATEECGDIPRAFISPSSPQRGYINWAILLCRPSPCYCAVHAAFISQLYISNGGLIPAFYVSEVYVHTQ